MTLQQLSYFLAAAEHGSFSAAAEALHLAQPTLSEQIRRLEAELGVPLFQRVGRRLELTEAGRLLLPARRAHARRRAGRPGVGARGARRCGRDRRLRHVRQRRTTTCSAGSSRSSAAATPSCAARGRPELGRGRRRRARRASSRPAWSCSRSTTAASTCARRCATSCSTLSAPTRARLREPMTIERLAAAPLILSEATLGRRRPDAPPAPRARPARRREDRARRSRSST